MARTRLQPAVRARKRPRPVPVTETDPVPNNSASVSCLESKSKSELPMEPSSSTVSETSDCEKDASSQSSTTCSNSAHTGVLAGGPGQGPCTKRARLRVRPHSMPARYSNDVGRAELNSEILKRVLSARSQTTPGFLTRVQKGITAGMREIVADWLMEVCMEFKVRANTLALSMSYLDRFLCTRLVARSRLQLAAIVCLLIAAKMEETEPPSIFEMVFICDHTYSADEVRTMEKFILNELAFRMTSHTPFSVLSHLADELAPGCKDVKECALFAAYVALLDYQLAADVGPGALALGCLQLALHVTRPGLSKRCVHAGPLTDGVVPEALTLVRPSLVGKVARRIAMFWAHIVKQHDAGNTRWLVVNQPNIAAKIFDPKVVDVLRNEMNVAPKIRGDFAQWAHNRAAAANVAIKNETAAVAKV